MNTYPQDPHRPPCFTALNLPTVLSPTTHSRPRNLVCFLFRGLPLTHVPEPIVSDPVPVGRIVIWASPFASRLATVTGRIEFVHYGPVVRFQLLSTSSHDDAVPFGYQPPRRVLTPTCTALVHVAPGRTCVTPSA